MATRTTPYQQPATDQPPLDLAALREAKRQLEAQIKAAKAAQPTHDRLAAEIERQETKPNASLPYCVGGMVKRRVRAGQAPDEAKAGVLAICARLMDEALAEPAADAE